MDYISRFRRKIQYNGKSQKERVINEGRRTFLKHLETSPAAFDVQITEPNEACVSEKTRVVRCLINNITLNDQRNLDEKYIHIPNGVAIRTGCYVKWDNQDWLILFREHNSIDVHRTYVMRKCSQIFKYKFGGKVYDIPVCISNLTLYSDGMADTKHTSIPDAKREIKFGLNDITKYIQLGTRFMLTNKTVFRITHMNDFEHNDGFTGADGVVTAIGLQTALKTGDDLDNNIALNKDYGPQNMEDSYIIVGESSIAIGTKSKYLTNKEENLTWRLLQKYDFVEIINQNSKECTLKVSNNGRNIGSLITLELLSGDTVLDKKEIKIVGFS